MGLSYRLEACALSRDPGAESLSRLLNHEFGHFPFLLSRLGPAGWLLSFAGEAEDSEQGDYCKN